MRFLFKKLSLPLIALLCSLLLWLFVTLEKHFETTVNIPIRLVNIPDNLLPTDTLPASASVLVAGSGKQILLLKYSKPELLINGASAKKGPVLFKLTGRNVRLAGNLKAEVLFVKSPSEITVNFDAVITKNLPIVADINVSLSENRIMIGEPILTPNKGSVRGPRANITRVGTLFTQPIQITNLSADTHFYAFIRRSHLVGGELNPNKVRVKIEVEPIKKRKITGIPLKLLDVPAGLKAKLNTKTVSLIIAGAQKDVEMIKKEYINVFVRYSRFSLEQLEEVEPTVSIIGNVQWSNVSPRTVHLKRR